MTATLTRSPDRLPPELSEPIELELVALEMLAAKQLVEVQLAFMGAQLLQGALAQLIDDEDH